MNPVFLFSVMDEDVAVKALAALAQSSRLKVFRAIVGAGPEGVQPGQLSAALDIPANMLSFHLKELHHAALVSVQREGRFLRYRADLGAMQSLMDFLTAHCCQGVPIGLVGEVHEVVDHQAIVTSHMVKAAAIGPVGAVGPVQSGQERGVGPLGLARPDPDEAVALDHRVGADGGKGAHTLAGHGFGASVATHDQAVVAANQLALADAAQGEGGATVGAKVFQGRHLALTGAVENDGLATDHAAQGLVRDLVGGAGDIPGVLGIHERLQIGEIPKHYPLLDTHCIH